MQTISKSLLIGFILLFLGGEALAQRGLKLGIRVSPLSARAAFTDSTSQVPGEITVTPQNTIAFGLVLSFGLTENVAIVTGVNYANLKVFTSQLASGANDTSLLQLLGEETKTTLSIPLGLRLRTPKFGRGWRVFANLGGVAELNTAYKAIQEVLVEQPGTVSEVQEIITAGTETIRGVTVSVVPRVGLHKETNFGTFSIGGSYHLPLQDFREAINSPDNLSARIQFIAIDLGYYF